jgi:hypothetical protein
VTEQQAESDGARLDAVESELKEQRGILDEIRAALTGGEHQAHAAAQKHEERKLDQPTTVADEIRAQLEERDRRQAAADEGKAAADRLAAVETSVREMAEKPPEAPIRRIERVFGWR